MDNKELKEKIIENVQANHMWVNAFAVINPNDELAKRIGYWIINNLRNKENLLPALFEGNKGEISKFQKLTPVFYCSINAS